MRTDEVHLEGAPSCWPCAVDPEPISNASSFRTTTRRMNRVSCLREGLSVRQRRGKWGSYQGGRSAGMSNVVRR